MRKMTLDGRIVHEAPLVNLTPDGARLKPGAVGNPSEVPDIMRERMQASLPPVIRRDPRQRFDQLWLTLLNDARNHFQRTGYIAWPQSIVNELKALGWKEGKPDMWAEVELLTRKYITESENKNKATASRSVTTPGHGH